LLAARRFHAAAVDGIIHVVRTSGVAWPGASVLPGGACNPATDTRTNNNGDTIYWVGTIEGATLTVTSTSGTGRFEGGSGGFVAEISKLVLDPMPPVVGGTISYTFEGTGAVTY